MPTKRKQYNLVLNDQADDILWQVAADLKLSALDTIRELLATHPKMVAKANEHGVTLSGKVDRGGYRGDDVKPSSSNQPAQVAQVETSARLENVKSNGDQRLPFANRPPTNSVPKGRRL